MSPESKFGLFFWTWKETFLAGRKPAVFLPFLTYALAQIFLVAGLIFFMYPPFSFVFLPLQRALGGELALHYPNYFLALPQAFDLLNLALSGILGIGVVGTATLFFALGNRPMPLRDKIAIVRGRYAHLFGAWLGETVLALLVIAGCEQWAARAPALGTYLAVARVLGVILVSALFAFTSVLIVLEKQPFLLAMTRSLKLFTSYGILTFFMIGLPSLLQFPVQFVLARTPVIVQKLNPEIIAVIVTAGIVAAMITNFLIIGAVTNLYRMIAQDPNYAPLAKTA